MVLQQVLRELEAVEGPIDLDNLARKLDVDSSALEGMIELLVRKGRLPHNSRAGFLCDLAPMPGGTPYCKEDLPWACRFLCTRTKDCVVTHEVT